MTLLATNLVGFGSGGGKATITFTDNSVAGSGQNQTFSTQSLGAAASDRYIIVGVAGEAGTDTVSSLTVAGVSATNVVVQQSGFSTAEIWIASVPTGTTGDIVVNWSGTQDATGIGVWAMYGGSATAHDTGSATGSGSVFSTSLTIPSDGVAVACQSKNNTSTATWAGVTEDYDEDRVAGRPHSGGSTQVDSGSTPTVSATWSSSGVGVMVTASFGPV